MNSFKMLPRVDDNIYVTAKITSAVTDADVGKPMKLSAADTYDLCADGDAIDGFLNSVEPHTSGGVTIGTVQVGGRRCVQLSGGVTIGNIVEAAAPAALNTAETSKLGKVSTKAVVNADITDAATGAQIAAAVNASLAELLLVRKKWQLVSGTGLTGDLTAVVERL